MFGSSYLNHLDMNTRFKVFASYNILQYLCDFIHVLIFVIVSKCRKSPKLTNIVMNSLTVPHEGCEQLGSCRVVTGLACSLLHYCVSLFNPVMHLLADSTD